jgi:SAM-dependent methyltransferase
VEASGGPARFTDEQRLAFGRAAELYDEIRPGYPKNVVDGLILTADLVDGDRVYEVGAGTGKGTIELARRGLAVLGIEPDPSMLRIARRHCMAFDRVSLIASDFEHFDQTAPRRALISFQAWHWTAPELRYQRAHRLLSPGGTLAAIWSFPDWQRCSLRQTLVAAYEGSAPGMGADFPMHPASEPTALAGDWQVETTAAGLFENPTVRLFRWCCRYSSTEYIRLLQTHQDHILLTADRRSRLLTTIYNAIEVGGGTIDLPLTSHLCTASRRDGA